VVVRAATCERVLLDRHHERDAPDAGDRGELDEWQVAVLRVGDGIPGILVGTYRLPSRLHQRHSGSEPPGFLQWFAGPVQIGEKCVPATPDLYSLLRSGRPRRSSGLGITRS
jgi:hypothetical protein